MPGLLKRRQELQKSLDEVNRTADKLLTQWAALDGQESTAFLGDKLNQLAQRRNDLEHGIEEIDCAVEVARQQAVDAAEVRRAMANVREVYGCLKPFEQKELMQLVLQGAEISESQMVLEIRAGVCVEAGEAKRADVAGKGEQRFERPDWLPTPVARRTFRYSFGCRLPSLTHLCQREAADRASRGTAQVVADWQRLLEEGVVKNRAELARRAGVSRARITRALRHT